MHNTQENLPSSAGNSVTTTANTFVAHGNINRVQLKFHYTK